MKKPGRPKTIRGNITEMKNIPDPNSDPPEEPAAETAETPNSEPATESQTQSPPTPQPTKRKPNFFQRVAAVPKADWGTRVFIYVYCLEPICNLKMGGESKYLVRLSEPIADEQALMVDYGSGKYRLQMVNRKPGLEKGDCLDIVEIEIYNPKYPPKIPRTVWINDPRNERWAALLPKEEPPAQAATALNSVTDAFKAFTDIRSSLRADMPPAPAPPQDSMANTLQLVQTIMAMKADNPMVTVLQEQLRLANESAEKARDREAALQKEMRERAATVATAAPAKDGIGQIKEVASTIEQLLNIPAVQKLLPSAKDAIESVGRSHRTNWLDIVREAAPSVLDWAGKITFALASRQPMPPPPTGATYPTGQGLTPQLAPPPAGQPTATNGAAPQPQQPGAQERLMQFLMQPAMSNAMMSYFRNPNTDGGDFAQWIADGIGEGPLNDARALGTERIMGMFKSAPQWPAIASQEQALTQFVTEIITWQPEPADEDEEPAEGADEGVDLTAQGV